MHTMPLQFSDVIYNAANQMFEALVTVHDPKGPRRYACAICAPIDMAFEDASVGLSKQALRRHARGALGSIVQPLAPPMRANAGGDPRLDDIAQRHAQAA